MKNRFVLSIAVILLILFCDKNRITDPAGKKDFTKDTIEILSQQNTRFLNVANPLGGILVTGWSLNDTIQIHTVKTIETTTWEIAEPHFKDIGYVSSVTNDTLRLSVSAPNDAEGIRYKYCSLSMQIPYGMNCIVSEVNGAIFIDQLSSNVFIDQSREKIQIDRHEGSCEIHSENDIKVVMTLPDTGFCRLNTNKGNISLNIPAATNASVHLLTENGALSFTDLVFTQLNQTMNSLTGILGTGEAELSIDVKQGDIKLTGIK
jgi:hypothetical protein